MLTTSAASSPRGARSGSSRTRRPLQGEVWLTEVSLTLHRPHRAGNPACVTPAPRPCTAGRPHDRPGGRSGRAAVGAAGLALAGHLQPRTRVRPGPVQHLGEHLGRLRAGDAVPLVDHVERHAGRRRTPAPARCRPAPRRRTRRRRAPRRRGRRRGRRSARRPRSTAWSPTSSARRKYAASSASLSSRWSAGPPSASASCSTPVGVDRVGVDVVEEAERQPLLRRDVDELLLHLAHLVLGAAVLAGQHPGGQLVAVLRRGRVQLEGAVDHLDLVAVRESGQRGLEAALADVAPGTDDVGPDLDLHDIANVGARTISPAPDDADPSPVDAVTSRPVAC